MAAKKQAKKQAPTKRPALEVRWRPIAEVRPSPGNSKRHPKEQIDLLKRSLERFGWTRPILVDAKGFVLAGHGMLEAARAAGRKEVPTIARADLSAKDAQAYVIADNKLAELGEWDLTVLGEQLATLAVEGLPGLGLLDLGFSADDIAGLTGIGIETGTLPSLPSGAKAEPVEVMNFTLTERQARRIRAALATAKTKPGLEKGNSNGCALALICDEWARG